MEFLTDPQLLIAFFTLTALELVLGIDNVIFISILVDKLPKEKRAFARRLGLFLAMFMRIALLAALSWMAGMTEPVVTVLEHGFSGRDLILLAGGLFLVWKSTQEVHQLMEGEEGEASSANNLPVMIAAVIASVGLMMLASGPIGEFVSRHPTVKMLALSFLLVIGVVLIADAFGHHVPKGYIYSAMAFSVLVEMLNLRMRTKHAAKAVPVKLHESYVRERGES